MHSFTRFRFKGTSINSIKTMMARQNPGKKRSIQRYVSILSRILAQQARLQRIYRSARKPSSPSLGSRRGRAWGIRATAWWLYR